MGGGATLPSINKDVCVSRKLKIWNVHAQRKDPTPGTQRNLYSTGWRWGFASGETQILCFASGETQILAFSDTNMLVYLTQNSGVGGLSQRQGPTFLRRSGI